MPLITQCDELGADGESLLRVDDAGVALLEALGGERVSVVAVAGMYRTGKSFFLNRLAGAAGAKSGGFGVGETTEPCTRGVWLWRSPGLRAADGSTLLLMDTEGLASADQDDSYDAKIFALALLLSSYFVLNVVGVIDDATIERLHLVSEVTKRVVVEGEPKIDDEDEAAVLDRSAAALAAHFPPLLVLVRDFALRPTRDGAPITDAEYLEDALRDRGGDAGDAKKALRHARRDAIRRSLRTLFPAGRRACATLVRPASDEAALRRATFLDDDELRPEFVAKLAALRAALVLGDAAAAPLEPARRKVVCGAAATGASLAALARLHVASINAGAAPSIRGAWDAAAREVNAKAADDAEKCYDDHVASKNPADDDDAPARGLPEIDDPAHGAVEDRFAVYEIHKDGAKKAMALFDGAACDGPDRPARRKKLRVALDRAGKRFREAANARSDACCAALCAEAAASHDEMIASAGDAAALARAWGDHAQALDRACRGPRRLRHLADALAARAAPALAAPAVALAEARGAAELADATARVEADRDAKVAAAEGRAAAADAREAEARERSEAEAAALRGRNESLAADLDACRDAKRAAEDAGDGERRRADDAEALAARTQQSLDDATGKIATLETTVAALEADVAAKDDALGAARRELRDAAAAAESQAESLAAALDRAARVDAELARAEDDASAAALRHGDALEQRDEALAAAAAGARAEAARADAAERETAAVRAELAASATALADATTGRAADAAALERRGAAAAAAAGVLGDLVATVCATAARERREAYLGAKVAAAERRADRAQSAADDARAASPAPVKAVRRLFSVGSEVMDKLGGAWLAHVDEELESFDPDAGTPPKPNADLPGFPTA